VVDLIHDTLVLIIDDSWFARNTLTKQLQGFGFTRFLEAGDADQAMSLLDNGGVGLIFCDQQMPGISGIELLRKLRGDQAFNDTLFILVTAHGDEELLAQCVEYGGDGVVMKPFSSAELQNEIKQAFQTRGQILD
jgi:two-component system chemotaxis response regulator CheY